MKQEPISELLTPIRRLHEQIRDTIVTTCERTELGELAEIAREEESDTIYAVDQISETLLIDFFSREIASQMPLVLIAEGLRSNGQLVLPEGVPEREALWRIMHGSDRWHSGDHVPEAECLDLDRGRAQ